MKKLFLFYAAVICVLLLLLALGRCAKCSEGVSESLPQLIQLFPADPPIVTLAPIPSPEALPPYAEDIPTLPSIEPVAGTPSPQKPHDNANGILGHLVVGKYSVVIRDNIDEDTLAKAPGWMPESAAPGGNGMCVILGHRNRNHLKLIENTEVGDEVLFRFLDNSTVSYTVINVQIFENSADWVLPSDGGNILVIATCYPFRYTGHAPGKYQLICQRND